MRTDIGKIVIYSAITFEVKRTLKTGERISAMSFNSSSKQLATYGFRTTKVWCVDTGAILYSIPNPKGQAFSMKFADSDTELVIGSHDRLIRVANLTISQPTWTVLHPELLKGDPFSERKVHNTPTRIVFNPAVNLVAVAYRGFPLSVFSLESTELVASCLRDGNYAGNRWTVVDDVIWHPQAEEVLGIYMGGQVFRWNPFDNTQQELEAEAKTIACSPDGLYFATGDSRGTIKLYNFHHFALVYTLSCENMINDICFSPDGKRLYDVRGQFCNVWEPNVLIRIDDGGGQESDVGSEMASLPTQAISESFAEVRDQITALAVQFRGRYQAIGNEAGVVSIVDSLEVTHVAVQLWKAPVSLSIGHLDWSGDGNYLASSELTGNVVVKRVELEDGLKWVASSVFDTKLTLHSEGCKQVLLNDNGTCLLVMNGPAATVYPLSHAADSARTEVSIAVPDHVWKKHPTDSRLLLAFTPNSICVHRWTDLSEVSKYHLNTQTSSDAGVDRILTTPPSPRFLLNTKVQGNAGEKNLASFFTLPRTPAGSQDERIPPLEGLEIVPEILSQIEIPLGILPKSGLVFLDKNYWVRSYNPDNSEITDDMPKLFFLPRDWQNVECLQFCTLLANGTILMPNNGELAVIKCAALR